MEPLLHAWNRQFQWEMPSGPYRRISDEQAHQYDEQGFFLLENAFDAETLQRAILEIDPIEAQLEAFLRTRDDGRLFIARAGEITFAPHLVTRSPWLRQFCAGPVFQDLMHDLIGPDVRLYWDQSVYKKPGTEAPFPWHQDNGYTYLEPQQYVTCWVALSDATVENGCPWVVPGLHRRGTLAHRETELGFVCLEGEPADALPVPARAGSIVVFSSLTPHATGPNRSDGIRKTYIVQFAPFGAEVLPVSSDPVPTRVPADAAERQFPVLVDGRAPGP